MEAVTEFIFLDSKITVDGDCSHEMKTPASWKENYDKAQFSSIQFSHSVDCV